jgi:hypothetical protein
MMGEPPKEYHLITFLRFEDGHLGLRLGKMNGTMMIWNPTARHFGSVDILGRYTLPRAMTSREALKWVNENFRTLSLKFPEIEEFRR